MSNSWPYPSPPNTQRGPFSLFDDTRYSVYYRFLGSDRWIQVYSGSSKELAEADKAKWAAAEHVAEAVICTNDDKPRNPFR